MINMKKEYLIRCNFKNNELICNDIIKLVANDSNSTVLKFNFEEELSNLKVLFKLKKQNSDFYWIKEVVNNRIEIVDFDEEENPLIVINEPGIYEFELSVYDENSRLTNYALLKDIRVREELIEQSDIDNYVSSSEKIPVLDQLINQNIAISNDEKLRIIAESNRDNNEKERISNEDIRKTNETIRKENEINREKYINDLKKDVDNGKFDGKDYILTEQDEDDIADKIKIKLEPDLEANLKASKDYTDNSILFDIKNVVLDKENYIMRFIRHDDTEIIFDLPVEMSFKDGYYDFETSELVFILMNDKEIRIPAAGLNKVLKPGETSTIKLSISTDGTITASVKGQSISKTHLTQELQDEINNKVNNDNYASSDKSGVIKVPDWSGLVVNSSGNLYPDVYTLERYKQRGINLALSKGTMENIKNAYVKEAIQSDEVKEELHNQGFVKDDDLKPLKKNIDDNTDRIKRIEYDIFDSGEAEGTSIYIEDSTFAEAIEIGNEGITNQKTTEGIQLIDFLSPNYIQPNSTYIFQDDTISLSIDVENTYSYAMWDITSFVKDNPESSLSFSCSNFSSVVDSNVGLPLVQITTKYNDETSDKYVSIYSPNYKRTYEIPANTNNIKKVEIQVYANRNDVLLPNSISITEPILYIGTKDNPPKYEKYTGAEPSPNLNYHQPIEVMEAGTYNLIACSKNLFNGSFEYGQVSADTGNNINNNLKEFVRTNYIYLGLTEDITFIQPSNISRNSKGRLYDSNKKYIGTTTYFIGGSISVKHILRKNLPENACYLRFEIDNDDSIIIDDLLKGKYEFGVYFGTDIETYEPYIESKIEVTIPEGEFVAKLSNTIKDKIIAKYNDEEKGYHLYLEKNIGKLVITKNSVIALNQINANGISNFWTNTSLFSEVKKDLAISNYLISQNTLINSTATEGFLISSNAVYLRIKSTRASNVQELKNLIDDKEIIIYGLLAEPYVLDLGITDMPLTFTEITNIFSDHPLQPNLHIKYYRDFKKTIKELQDKVQTLETDAIKNTDYATTTNPGIIKVPEFAGLTISEKGSLFPQIYTLEQYGKRDVLTAISKGTLEAVLQPIRDKLEELSPSINQESEVNSNDLLQE